jgi:hypothetical protein
VWFADNFSRNQHNHRFDQRHPFLKLSIIELADVFSDHRSVKIWYFLCASFTLWNMLLVQGTNHIPNDCLRQNGNCSRLTSSKFERISLFCCLGTVEKKNVKSITLENVSLISKCPCRNWLNSSWECHSLVFCFLFLFSPDLFALRNHILIEDNIKNKHMK